MPDSWLGLHQLKKYKFPGNRINTSEDTGKKSLWRFHPPYFCILSLPHASLIYAVMDILRDGSCIIDMEIK